MPLFIPTGTEPSLPLARYTTGELIEEVLGHLHGHTMDMGQVTTLTKPLDINDLTFQVADEGVISRGIVEIGYELVFVSSVDGNVCHVAPFGRGYRASFPARWSEGTEVSYGPRYPRSTVLNELNDVISGTYPQLFAVGEHEFKVSGVRRTHELPSDVEEVLSVSWRPVTPSGTWKPVDRFRFDGTASKTEYESGKTITLPGIQPGRVVHVKYRRRPAPLPMDGEFTDTGYAETAWPAMKFGALHRLAASLTLGRLESDTAQAAEYNRIARRPVAIEVSREYYALHQQYLAEERERLQRDVAKRVHFRGR